MGAGVLIQGSVLRSWMRQKRSWVWLFEGVSPVVRGVSRWVGLEVLANRKGVQEGRREAAHKWKLVGLKGYKGK